MASKSIFVVYKQTLFLAAVHLFCLSVYLIPIWTYRPSTPKHGGPVLDELHIVSPDNADVHYSSSSNDDNNDWKVVFQHDYWGRPMTSPSSHKSWRPLSVLSFRWLQLHKNALHMHRLVNVVAHAATAEFVSLLALQLMVPSFLDNRNGNQASFLLLQRTLVKLCFALHPTHVEATANAANRPHLLAVLSSVVSCDVRIHILLLCLLQLFGLGSCETYLFQMPAIIITMTVIAWKQRKRKQQQGRTDTQLLLRQCMLDLAPRYAVILLSALAYIGTRYFYDTLSIPDGLIRPAENPFYEFEKWHRVRNYAYVLSIHIGKSMYVDWIGFSHEYGFDCIPAIATWTDGRLLVPCAMAGGLGIVVVACLKRGLQTTLLLLVHLSWMATLFPISGVVKVGTFVADRIVVASTVSVSILLGVGASRWIMQSKTKKSQIYKSAVVLLFVLYSWRRVHLRTLEWMDSEALLRSSLATCPRNAKSHLEISKVYSGLYPDRFNLTRSWFHLEMAESIDPSYCDVHQQFAHVLVQQQRYLEFEERLTKAMLCPFTMGGAMDMWNRYWSVALQSGDAKNAQQRKEKYSRIIQAAVEEEKRKEERAAAGVVA